MSRGFPSMTALLGLLAIAGYQNRDKIAEMLGSAQGGAGTGQSGLGGLLGQLSGGLGAGGVGGLLSGGIGELVDRFKQSGQADTVDSWVGTGPNKQIAVPGRTGHWPGCAGDPLDADGIIKARTPGPAFTRTA